MAVTANEVRALDGCLLRDFAAASTVAVGDCVYIGTSGVARTDADAESTSAAVGIVVAVQDQFGSTTAAAGQRVSVCIFGPVSGFSSLTAGALQYIGTTAGALTETATSTTGDVPYVIGRALSSSILFVTPNNTVPDAN